MGEFTLSDDELTADERETLLAGFREGIGRRRSRSSELDAWIRGTALRLRHLGWHGQYLKIGELENIEDDGTTTIQFEFDWEDDEMAEHRWMAEALWDEKALFDELSNIMQERHSKYGPGNISRHGVPGILVRIDDKLARLSHSGEDFSDESYRDAWLDVVNYGLIALMFLDGTWPGSEKDPA